MARYVRIMVQSWKHHAAMRAAVDVGTDCIASRAATTAPAIGCTVRKVEVSQIITIPCATASQRPGPPTVAINAPTAAPEKVRPWTWTAPPSSGPMA